MFSSIKKIALALTVVSALSLTACLQGEDTAAESPTTHLRVKASVASVFGKEALGKGNAISYSKIIITLSAAGTPVDTVRDTIRAGVSQGFTANSSIDQFIDSNYTLKALRNWKVTISVRDLRDSVTHEASITPAATSFTRIGDTVVVPFGTLVPRFAQYRAVFGNLPDSVTTSATLNKQGVRFTRLVVRIDGKVVRDSINNTAPNYHNALPADTLDWDYVAPGLHTVRLAAYGMLLNAAGVALITDTLFVGQDTVTAVAGVHGSRPITLNWTNPNNNKGNEKFTVTIGQIGRTTVTGSTNGNNVVPKSKK